MCVFATFLLEVEAVAGDSSHHTVAAGRLRLQDHSVKLSEELTVALSQLCQSVLGSGTRWVSSLPFTLPNIHPQRFEGERWRAAGDSPLTVASGRLLGTHRTHWDHPESPRTVW